MGEAGYGRNQPANTGLGGALLRHIGNIFRFSSSDFGQSLLSDSGLSIGRFGDDRLARHVKSRESLVLIASGCTGGPAAAGGGRVASIE